MCGADLNGDNLRIYRTYLRINDHCRVTVRVTVSVMVRVRVTVRNMVNARVSIRDSVRLGTHKIRRISTSTLIDLVTLTFDLSTSRSKRSTGTERKFQKAKVQGTEVLGTLVP